MRSARQRTLHYADARWQGQAVDVQGVARIRMIEQARTRMLAACVSEGWSETIRACFAIGGYHE
jgi:hypothetical protein